MTGLRHESAACRLWLGYRLLIDHRYHCLVITEKNNLLILYALTPEFYCQHDWKELHEGYVCCCWFPTHWPCPVSSVALENVSNTNAASIVSVRIERGVVSPLCLEHT